MSALEDILTRLCAVQTEIVPGSVAYPDVFITTQNTLYWTNQIDVSMAAGNARLGSRAAQIAVTVTARLHRGKFTENLTDATLGARCRDDVRAAVAYFAGNRDLTSAAYPTAYPELVSQSVIYQRGQVVVFSAPDGTQHIGSVHTITFAYIEKG